MHLFIIYASLKQNDYIGCAKKSNHDNQLLGQLPKIHFHHTIVPSVSQPASLNSPLPPKYQYQCRQQATGTIRRVSKYDLTRKLNISEPLILRWGIGTYPFAFHPVVPVFLVFLTTVCNICNYNVVYRLYCITHQKLTSKTPKSEDHKTTSKQTWDPKSWEVCWAFGMYWLQVWEVFSSSPGSISIT